MSRGTLTTLCKFNDNIIMTSSFRSVYFARLLGDCVWLVVATQLVCVCFDYWRRYYGNGVDSGSGGYPVSRYQCCDGSPAALGAGCQNEPGRSYLTQVAISGEMVFSRPSFSAHWLLYSLM